MTSPTDAERDGLVERLRDGCISREKRWAGDTFSDLGNGCIDEPATDGLMIEAAAEITRLRADLADMKAEWQAEFEARTTAQTELRAKDAEITRLRAEVERKDEALRESQAALAMLISPGTIGQTTVLTAFAAATAAEARTRAALEQEGA